jgi:hypothetical protein
MPCGVSLAQRRSPLRVGMHVSHGSDDKPTAVRPVTSFSGASSWMAVRAVSRETRMRKVSRRTHPTRSGSAAPVGPEGRPVRHECRGSLAGFHSGERRLCGDPVGRSYARRGPRQPGSRWILKLEDVPARRMDDTCRAIHGASSGWPSPTRPAVSGVGECAWSSSANQCAFPPFVSEDSSDGPTGTCHPHRDYAGAGFSTRCRTPLRHVVVRIERLASLWMMRLPVPEPADTNVEPVRVRRIDRGTGQLLA